MRLIETRADGEEKRELPPPFRNPFAHELRFTAAQKLQIGLMTVTLFPIRLFIAAFMMLLAWPFAFIASVGRSERAVEPQCLWRNLIDKQLQSDLCFVMHRRDGACTVCRSNVGVGRSEPLIPRSQLSVHLSLSAQSSRAAEDEEERADVTLIRYIRPVFVSRSDQDSRRQTVEEIKRRAHSGEWPQIMIFPEGTCTNRTCLITFKPGAFIPAVPVQPVVIRYPNKLDTITWTWQGPGALKRVNSEKLLQDYGKRARKLQGQRLSLEDFAQFLELPASGELRHMFALFDENEDHSMDVREFVVAFSVVCRPAKTLDTIRLAFQMFEAEEDGAITENELMCILRTALGVGELRVSRLFRAIDEEDSGKITFERFREFVDQHPDFAEQYLYSDNTGFGSSSPSHAANGFCADFSPREQKKLD
ncbi:lysophosphatidylcholine acyltransferase 1-like [Sinocyclocheilus grahami]|uniref:lysophosphatidylcholine acyltransferase 1-like n=1 Tax=Sinocyclocheilus grahami TaxID=75366 RepID=UPI0007AD2F88|nr:PREDICTED: lysophosphatidylcholine acyltransferase 1-like [Sinocyclocheilus grahami]